MYHIIKSWSLLREQLFGDIFFGHHSFPILSRETTQLIYNVQYQALEKPRGNWSSRNVAHSAVTTRLNYGLR